MAEPTLAQTICESLGLSPDHVSHVEIDITPKGVKVKVDILMTDEQGRLIAEAMQRVTFIPEGTNG